MRQAAKQISLTASDDVARKRAGALAVSAFLLAQNSTTTPVTTFWRAGISAARCLMAAGDVDGAEALYRQLSLPQWTDTDRAVAYLDWQFQLRQAGQDEDSVARVREMLEDLGLNNPQMRSVEWSWHTLN